MLDSIKLGKILQSQKRDINVNQMSAKEFEETFDFKVDSFNNSDSYKCIHWDNELGFCKYKTSWSNAMPDLIGCCGTACCDFFEKKIDHCRWCNSYRIDDDLRDDNDFHAGTRGSTTPNNQIMLVTGNNDAPRIEFNRWDEQHKMYHTVGLYYPKYCPECGRHITEWPEVLEKEINIK